MKKPVLVIMAAGMGSRYGGMKQIDPVDEYGHIIVDFSIYDAYLAGFTQALHGIFMCFRLPYVKRNLMFEIFPVICHRIVHMYRIPDNICQKAYCIFMKRFCLMNTDAP